MENENRRVVTLGILGRASVAHSLVVDVLGDHFSLGAEDAEGYFGPSDRYDLRLIIPAGQEVTAPGVHAVWEWAIRCELPYTVLWDDTSNEHTDAVLGNVHDPETDIVTVSDVEAAMVEHLGHAENPMLLILSSDGEIDEATAGAAAVALREDIPVHDLSRALREVTWQHLPGHEAPEEEPAVEEEPGGQMALSVVDGAPDLTLSAGEAAAITQALADAEAFIFDLEELLGGAGGLRQNLVRGRSLLAPKPEAPAEDEAGEKKAKKTRLEIFNAESGKWEPAGRGRPPKDAQTRRVPVG